jgi:hypothetical protein
MEVQGAGAHPHQDFTGSRHRRLAFLNGDFIKPARGFDGGDFHGVFLLLDFTD